ncbi:MAG: hypothetical protein EAX86_02150 [Candidatus Heimdallarchaeota archaeon]|nr:hypothetical protein [Candidatus Heimdallarchaeota archaeon]
MPYHRKLSSEVFPRKLFWETFIELDHSVEKKLLIEILQISKKRNLIFEVLDEQGWSEWKDNPDKLVKGIVPLLIALFCDRITISISIFKKSFQFEDLVAQMRRDIGSSSSNKKILSFFNLVSKLLDQSPENDSEYPITCLSYFPLNRILHILFESEDECLLGLILIQELLHHSDQQYLLLPFLYENGVPSRLQQLQGQVFTPPEITNFLAKFSLSKADFRKIIDPACGTGLFLLAALDYISHSHQRTSLKYIIGIEKDPYLGSITKSAINYFLYKNPSMSVKSSIIIQDFFCLNNEEEKRLKSDEKVIYYVNPPYTRQENIPMQYKTLIQTIIQKDLIFFSKTGENVRKEFSRRSGLYAYFLLHIAGKLKENDSIGLIIPNSWLDVDYGLYIRQLLYKYFHIHTIIMTTKEKLIPAAEVNTVILYVIRDSKKSIKQVNYYLIERKSDLALISLGMREKIPFHKKFDQHVLDPPKKWNAILKAPNCYLNLLNLLNDKLMPLKSIASIKRGFTTGANDFFYLGKPGCENKYFRSEWDSESGDLLLYLRDDRIQEFYRLGWTIKEPMFRIEKEYWMHSCRNKSKGLKIKFVDSKEVEWIPNYVVKSPKELQKFEINESEINYVVLIICHSISIEKGVQEYIHWGEKWVPSSGRKYPLRPTCKTRANWFCLPLLKKESFPILGMMTINDRFAFFYNPSKYYFDARFYGIQLTNSLDEIAFIFLFLNSIVAAFQLELLGRSNLGEGGLDIKVYEYEDLMIPNINLINGNAVLISKKIFKETIHKRPLSIREVDFEDEFIKVNLLFNVQLDPEVLKNLKTELETLVRLRLSKAKSFQ